MLEIHYASNATKLTTITTTTVTTILWSFARVWIISALRLETSSELYLFWYLSSRLHIPFISWPRENRDCCQKWTCCHLRYSTLYPFSSQLGSSLRAKIHDPPCSSFEASGQSSHLLTFPPCSPRTITIKNFCTVILLLPLIIFLTHPSLRNEDTDSVPADILLIATIRPC